MNKTTVGQTLQMLRTIHQGKTADLYKAIKVSSATYRSMEKDKRDISFLMAVRLCQFFKIQLDDLVDLLDPGELERRDLSSIRFLTKRAEKRRSKEHAT